MIITFLFPSLSLSPSLLVCRCEVSAEAPNFQTVRETKTMLVFRKYLNDNK